MSEPEYRVYTKVNLDDDDRLAISLSLSTGDLTAAVHYLYPNVAPYNLEETWLGLLGAEAYRIEYDDTMRGCTTVIESNVESVVFYSPRSEIAPLDGEHYFSLSREVCRQAIEHVADQVKKLGTATA